MRILHIVSGDKWAGAEVQVWTLCTALVKAGHSVHCIILNEGRLAKELEAAGVKVYTLPEEKLTFFHLFQKMRAILNNINPEIVHTHRQKENILGSLANLFSKRVPCFKTVHGAPEFSPTLRQRIQIVVDQYCGRYLQKGIVSVSDDLTNKLSAIYSPHKIATIANGIDIDDVTRDSTLPGTKLLSSNVIHIGFVGRIEPVKRVDIFLQVAKNMLRNPSTEKTEFHIFGEGSQRPLFEEWVSKEKLSGSIRFYGHCDNIRGWIKQMDFLLMPSDHEGLPMTALESLALNVPLVAHATGGLVPLLSESFEQGLVYEHSVEAYTQRLQAVVGKKWNVFLPEQYLSQKNAKQYIDLYSRFRERK